MIRASYPTQKELQERYTYHNGHLYQNGQQVIEYSGSSTNKYIAIYYDGRNLCIHRLIYILMYGDIPDDMDIDHVNRDYHDNRVENLRVCTRSLNSCNAKPRPNSITGVRGVYKRKGKNGMFAVTVCGKYIGQWHTIDEAIIARERYIQENVR